jgi:hypothetical protein
VREWPIVEPAPVVTDRTGVFRDLCENQCQFRHVQHDLTGLIVLPNKSRASMARGILDSADNTTLSRVLSEVPWREDEVNRRRITFMLQQTKPHRRQRRASLVVIDDTLCEHVGSLWDHVDRHDNHGDGPSPLAHNPVTSFSVSGAVRFPLDLRLDRRDEALTPWEAAVTKHVPDGKIPTDTQARRRLPQQVDPVWLQDPAFRSRHEPLRTKSALAIDLGEGAIRHNVPCGGGVFDAWYLAEAVVRVLARRCKDGIRILNTNRRRETASLHLRDANGWALKLPGPQSAGEDLGARIPATAYHPVKVREHPYWCCTLGVRIPGLGQGRIVVSFEQESLTGRALVVVTNRVDWRAATIISLYGHRWPTETFDQDGQGPLGFNEDRMRSVAAMGKPWCLVVVASSLLHLTCRPAVPDRTTGLIQTIGDACRQQGRALLQRLLVCVHDQLSQGVTADHVFARIFAKQQGIVLV